MNHHVRAHTGHYRFLPLNSRHPPLLSGCRYRYRRKGSHHHYHLTKSRFHHHLPKHRCRNHHIKHPARHSHTGSRRPPPHITDHSHGTERLTCHYLTYRLKCCRYLRHRIKYHYRHRRRWYRYRARRVFHHGHETAPRRVQLHQHIRRHRHKEYLHPRHPISHHRYRHR